MNKDECKDLLDELDYYAISDANPHPVLPHQDLIDLCAQAAAKIRALAAMQAGEPVGYGQLGMEGGKTFIRSINEDYHTKWRPTELWSHALYVRPQATSEAEAMLAHVLEHGLPEFALAADGKIKWHYSNPDCSFGIFYETRESAIRAAINVSTCKYAFDVAFDALSAQEGE